jgi:hypothetical protein
MAGDGLNDSALFGSLTTPWRVPPPSVTIAVAPGVRAPSAFGTSTTAVYVTAPGAAGEVDDDPDADAAVAVVVVLLGVAVLLLLPALPPEPDDPLPPEFDVV